MTSFMVRWSSESYLKDTIERRTYEDILEEERFWLATARRRLVEAGKLASFEGEFEKEGEIVIQAAPE
jgi:hypothetical protein